MLIEFEYRDSILALYTLCFKTIWGFNDPEHFKLFLNDVEFSSKNLNSEDRSSEDEIEEFILKNEITLKDKNTIKIEILNNTNINYCKHIMIIFNENIEIEDFFIKK
jgi:hypothetical protein